MADHFHFLLPDRESAASVGAQLASSPGFDSCTRYRGRRMFLDTFDDGLNSAGMVFECDAKDGVCSCRLRLAGDEKTEFVAASERPPGFARDLDNPRDRKRLQDLIEERALLVRGDFDVHGQRYCIRNDEQKIVGYYALEELRAKNASSGKSRAAHVLRVLPLRGYERWGARLPAGLKSITAGYALRADYADALLDMIGVVPRAYNPKPTVTLKPDAPCVHAIVDILSGYRAVMLANEEGMRDQIDIEFLHDFRVAMRRSRSIFAAYSTLFGAADARHFRREFAWLNKATGETRDLDVFLASFGRLEDLLRVRPPELIAPLKIYIKAEHRRAHRGLSRTLASKRYALFVGRWAELLHASRIAPHAGGDSTRPILPAANRAIWDAYVRVRKGKRKIDRHCEIELLHALRKDCKKLRYLLEAFQSLYKAAPLRRAVDALRKLQDELGHICDIDVQANFLRECRPKASRHAAAEGEFEAAVIELENCLFHQKLALLETINRSLARFTSKSNHGRFVRLFDAGKTAG